MDDPETHAAFRLSARNRKRNGIVGHQTATGHGRKNRQRFQSHGSLKKSACFELRAAAHQIIARPAVEPHPLALFPGDYTEAIMLDFDRPFQPTGWLPC
jgi:hypothetical protein